MLKELNHPLLEKYRQAAAQTLCVDFFAREKVLALARQAELSDDNIKLLWDFLEYADETVLQFMWLFYYVQYESGEDFTFDIWSLDDIPMPKEPEERFPGCIKAVVYLVAYGRLEQWVKQRGLAREIALAYFERYRYLVSLNLITHGTCGLCRLSPFLYGYSKPFMLCIGRLAYQVIKFKDYSELYEDEQGSPLFAALPNYTYGPDGLQAEDGFVPVYEKRGSVLFAHTFDEKGHLKPEPEEIDLTRYRRILSPEDVVVTIHIPEGGRLDMAEVQRSLEDAAKIVGENFPEAKAFVCQTWFIDPNLRGEVIRDGSNMASFGDPFHVICGPDNKNHSIFEHIFKVKPQPLENLVPQTGLQERVLRRALAGGKIHWSFGVLKKKLLK